MNIQETTLSNGFRVVTTQVPGVESAALGLWIGVGSRYESAACSGISHFIEHLLFKGTRNRSAREISAAIEGRGGYLNAHTQEETTCYYARIARDHLWSALDVMLDLYAHPLLAAGDMERERKVIVEEIMMYRDDPQHIADEACTAAVWKDHPLGRSITGTPETLQGISRQDVLGFLGKSYVPRNTVIVFAGDLDHAECVKRVAAYRIPAKPVRLPKNLPMSRRVRQDALVLQNSDIEQTHLAMGFRIFGRYDPRRYACKILSTLLGETMSSRLFYVIRETHGLAYSINTGLHLLGDTGVFSLDAGLDRARTLVALQFIARELKRARDRKPGRNEVARARDYVIGQMKLALEGTNYQMMWAGDYGMGYGHIPQPETVMDRFRSVTPDEVQAVAREVLNPERLSIAMVSPDFGVKDSLAIKKAMSIFCE